MSKYHLVFTFSGDPISSNSYLSEEEKSGLKSTPSFSEYLSNPSKTPLPTIVPCTIVSNPSEFISSEGKYEQHSIDISLYYIQIKHRLF